MNVLQKRFYLYSAVFIVLIAVMFVLHLGTGFADLSSVDLARILLGGGPAEEDMTLSFKRSHAMSSRAPASSA